MFGSVTKSLAQWMLDKFLGKYVDNLALDSLKGSLTSGYELKLQNLSLKPEALVGLDLPIEVKAGYIGSLILTIPGLTRLYSDSVVLKIDRLVLLASPIADRDYNQVQDEALLLAHKRDTLDKLEKMLLAQITREQQAVPDSDQGFLENIKLTILQNLRVDITLIHIRFENEITDAAAPFAAGLTLDTLSLQASAAAPQNNQLIKVLKLDQLAVYWNCNLPKSALLKHLLNSGEVDWREEMAESINRPTLLDVKFVYMVDPIVGEAEMKFNLKSNNSQPKVTLNGTFQLIQVNFTRSMYLNAVQLKDSFELMRITEPYRKYRPAHPIRKGQSTSAWWQFAIKCVVEFKVKPKRDFWVNLFEYRKLYKDYVRAYLTVITTQKPAEGKLKKEIDRLELRLNIESIVMARKQAEKQYARSPSARAVVSEAPVSGGFFSGISSWWYGETEKPKTVVKVTHSTEGPTDLISGLSDEERKELYKAFKYKENGPPTQASSGYTVNYRADVTLEGIQLNLLVDSGLCQESKSTHVASLFVTQIQGMLAIRPVGWLVEASLCNFEVYQHAIPTKPRVYVAQTDVERGKQVLPPERITDQLLTLTLELKPENSDADFRVDITTIPVRFIYQHEVVTAALAFFYLRTSRFNIKETMETFQPEFTSSGLKYAIDKQMKIDVRAELSAPYLILPDTAQFTTCKKLLLLDLGHMTISSDLRQKTNRSRNPNEKVSIKPEELYDAYTLSLKDIKLIYTDIQSWQTSHNERDSREHIIPSISMESRVLISAEPQYTQLPMIKLKSVCKKLEVKVTETDLESFVQVYAKFPKPDVEAYLHKHGRSVKKRRSTPPAFKQVGLQTAGAGMDDPDHGVNLLLKEQGTSETVETIDFQRLEELEDRHIYTTQGDLYNLWLLMSTECNKNEHIGSSVDARGSGFNAVTSLLNRRTGSAVPRMESVVDDDEFVDAREDAFSAKELSVFDLPGIDGYMSVKDNYYTIFYTKFTINEVILRLMTCRQNSSLAPSDFLTLSLSGLAGRLAKTSVCLSACLQLSEFTMLDSLHLTGTKPCKLVCSKPGESLVSLDLRRLDEGKTLCAASAQTEVRFAASQLDVTLQDEAILKVRQLVSNLSSRLKLANPTGGSIMGEEDIASSRISVGSSVSSRGQTSPKIPDPSVTSEADAFFDAKSSIDGRSKTSSVASRRREIHKEHVPKLMRARELDETDALARRGSRNKKPSTRIPPHILRRRRSAKQPSVDEGEDCDIVKVRVTACMKKISVQLQKSHLVLAQLQASDMSAALFTRESGHLEVSAKLGQLYLCNPVTPVYRDVLILENKKQKMMSLTFKILSKNEQLKRGHDQELCVRLEQMKFVYVSTFINQIQSFLVHCVSSTAAETAKKASVNAAITTANKIHSPSSKLLLDIEASAPLIILPENERSRDGILLTLGDLWIGNGFTRKKISKIYQEYNNLEIKLDNMKAERLMYGESNRDCNIEIAERYQLLTPISTEVNITQALSPVHKSAVDLKVSANIRLFQLDVSESDMQLIGKVLYQNILAPNPADPDGVDYLDIASNVSSQFSSHSLASSGSGQSSALKVELNLEGFTVVISQIVAGCQQSSRSTRLITTDLARCVIGSAQVNFNKSKTSGITTTEAGLSNFTIEDMTSSDCGTEFSTNHIVSLSAGTDRLLSVRFIQSSPEGSENSDSDLSVTVKELRVNLNVPFIKSAMEFLQNSFSTWKSEDLKPELHSIRPSTSRTGAIRLRKQAVGLNRRLTSRLTPQQARTTPLRAAPNRQQPGSSMKISLTLGKQSLWMNTGDGSYKALVAELDCSGIYKYNSSGQQQAHFSLRGVTVYSTSLSNETLQHQILYPCSIKVHMKHTQPLPHLRGRVPPLLELNIKLSEQVRVDISTNLIYHVFDAIEILTGSNDSEDSSDTQTATDPVPDNIGVPVPIDTQDWVDKYKSMTDYPKVEVNPSHPSRESAAIEPFDLDLKFSVAIGEEFRNILRCNVGVAGSVSDWSTRMRANADLSLQCDFYNEKLDVWEPLIEPNYDPSSSSYDTWSLLLRFTRAPSHPITRRNADEILSDARYLDPVAHQRLSNRKQIGEDGDQQDGERLTMDPSPASTINASPILPAKVAKQESFDSSVSKRSRIPLPPPPSGLQAAAVTTDLSMIVEENYADSALSINDATPLLAGTCSSPALYITQPSLEDRAPRPPANLRPLLMSSGAPDNSRPVEPLPIPSPPCPIPTRMHDEIDRIISLPATDELPLIEESDAGCDSIMTLDDDADGVVDVIGPEDSKAEVLCNYLVILSREKLNINVSPTGVNVLHTIVNTLTHKPKDSVLFGVAKSMPLVIKNDIDIPLQIALHRRLNPNQVTLGKQITLVPPEEMALSEVTGPHAPLEQKASLKDSVHKDDVVHLLAATSALKYISSSAWSSNNTSQSKQKVQLHRHEFNLSAEGYYPITNINYRKTLERHYSLHPRNNKRSSNMCITIRTGSKHSQRKIAIYSKLSIYNDLNCTIQVFYQGLSSALDGAITTTSWDIAPGKWFNVPAIAAQTKRLYIRPVTDATTSEALGPGGRHEPRTDLNTAVSTTSSGPGFDRSQSAASEANTEPDADINNRVFQESREALWWGDHTKQAHQTRTLHSQSSSKESQRIACLSANNDRIFACKAVWLVNPCKAANCGKTCPAFNVLIKPCADVENYLPFSIQLQLDVEQPFSYRATYFMKSGDSLQIRDSLHTTQKCVIFVPEYQGRAWKGNLELNEAMVKGSPSLNITLTEVDVETGLTDTVNPSHLAVSCKITNEVDELKADNMKISFYSPYWLSNTTGRHMQFKPAGLHQVTFTTDQPFPYIFNPRGMKHKLRLRVPEEHHDDSQASPHRHNKETHFKWSKAIDCDSAGTLSIITSTNYSMTRKYRFIVEVTLTTNKLTKIVTVFPMFVLINSLPYCVEFREFSPEQNCEIEADEWCDRWNQLQPGKSRPFWPDTRSEHQSMIVAVTHPFNRQHSATTSTGEMNPNEEIEDEGEPVTRVTKPFSVDRPLVTLLPLGESFITAEVTGGVGTEYYITLRPYQQSDIPVKVENLTQSEIMLVQGDIKHDGSGTPIAPKLTSDTERTSVPPSHSLLHLWPRPLQPRNLYWTVEEVDKKPKLNHLQLGKDGNGQIQIGEKTVYWESRTEALQRVVSFTDEPRFRHIIQKRVDEEQSVIFFSLALESLSISLLNESCEVSLISALQYPSKWHVQLNKRYYYLGEELSALLEDGYVKEKPVVSHGEEELNISLKDMQFKSPFSGKLLRQSFPGIRIQYQQSDLSSVIQARINHMQVDNLLVDAFYPVAFQPQPWSQHSIAPGGDDSPSICAVVCKTFKTQTSPDSYKQIDLSVKEHALRIDKGFALSLIDFITECMKTGNENNAQIAMEGHLIDLEYCMRTLDTDTEAKTKHDVSTKMYIEHLQIQPIHLKLSLSLSGKAHVSNSQNTKSSFGGDVVDFLISSVGLTFTEVTDIEFNLSGDEILCTMTSLNKLMADLQSLYIGKGLRSAYVLVFGLDFLGNPLGLVRNVGRGVNLLMTPKAGHVKDQFGRVNSALRLISGSFSGTTSKITESVGRAFSTLTFDDHYKKKRIRRLKTEPSNLPAIMLLSGKALVYSFLSGFTGIVNQPRVGIREHGARGFFTGTVKGVTGVITKPFGGLFDSISVMFAGSSRLAEYGEFHSVRVRNPRPVIPDEGYRIYEEYFAEGFRLLSEVNQYVYSPDDVYWSHLVIQRPKHHLHIAMVTTRSVYLLYQPWYSSMLKVHWKVEFKQIDTDKRKMKLVKDVINIYLKGALTDENRRQISSPDFQMLHWFYKTLKHAFRHWSTIRV